MTRIIGCVPTFSLKISLDNYNNDFPYDTVKDAVFEVQPTDTSRSYFYKAYEMPESWDNVLEITLYDCTYCFDIPYETKLEYPQTIKNQLDEMQSLTGIEIDYSILEQSVLNRSTNQYDTSIAIRSYLRWIAEIGGCNVFASSDVYNKVEFVRFDQTPFIKYSQLLDYKKGNPYAISKITYNDGLRVFDNGGDESGNVYYLSNDGMYIIEQDDIRIASQTLQGLSIHSATKVVADYTDNLTLGKIVDYNDEFKFIVLNLEENYVGGTAPDLTLDGELTTKNQEAVGVRVKDSVRLRRLKVITDEQALNLKIVAEQQEQINSKIKNTISVSLTLNYVASQTYDQALDKFYPDYKTQPLVITATATDLTKNEVKATWMWKRKGREDQDYVDLIDGEAADKNVLTISHNLSESVEYIAYATVSTGTANDSIEVSYNVLEDTTIDGETVQIVGTTNMFQEKDGDYDPSNISLMPKLFNCNFDIWSYSIDYGVTYTDIIPTDTQVVGDDDVKETNVVGIQQNVLSNELLIDSEAECFLTTNVVVFKLKADKANAENTIAITKNSDVSQKVIDLVNAVDRLEKQYTEVSLELDGVNNSITSRVESMEETYNNGIGEINKQLTTVIQTSQYIEEQFNVLKEIVNENGGELQTITTYIRKTAKGIEVGELNAKVKTLMATSYFAILFNDEEVMKLEQNLLTIDRVRANIGFQLGGSIWNVKDYGFDISWGGE